ncbi:PAS domain-containing sensor histidine kinase [Flavobacterium psychrotrophum]|uniref:PAS domain-containing sensor histidine kinase n=1 Tax=Flavobacterium psychrotrophum TaxID=2294119 RepID=UPI000E316888|nr:ATP-binding protein [Flavobacterium psychrotrophum]
MKEIISIRLDNEMDLILAHKRSIKLAELCGLMASSQTRFATAVSEIARCAIASGLESYLVLGINSLNGGKKEITAVLHDKIDLAGCNPEAFNYAKRLVKDIITSAEQGDYKIILAAKVPYSGILSELRISSFIEYFKKEAPLSAYDEIRKKNIQLIELADKVTESENNYRQLTDTLPFIVFSVSKSDKIFVTNKSAENLLGTTVKEFSPAIIHKLFYADDAESVIKAWSVAKKKQSVQSIQARLFTASSPVWYQVYIVPNTDEKENSTGWIISMINIHAQKLVEETLKDNKELREAQQKLKEYNDELQLKNKELEQFAYIASHDLQEPLRKIRNFISLSQHNRKDEEKQDFYFSKISGAAERMSQLIKDVLGYSRLAVKPELFTQTDLNKIIEEVKNDLEFTIREKGAEINAEDLPTVMGSPVQLSQLFYNLISNSLKFNTSKPIINVTISRVSEDAASFYKITVKDNGIGIEPHHIGKVFTIFKRLHSQNEYPGTGIGLALCKKIVENHSGKIEIDTGVNNGTSISIYLPASK